MKSLKESFEILRKFPVADWKIVKSEDDFPKQFPFYLKADVVGHKTEINAVKKCRNIDEARMALIDLRKRFDVIIAQKEVDGIEMIVGIKNDNVFSKLLVVGFGGIFVEVMQDISFRALPVTRHDIIDMIRDLQHFPIFESRKKFVLSKFVKLIYKLSKTGIEMELNPVVVGEKEVKIADARVGPSS